MQKNSLCETGELVELKLADKSFRNFTKVISTFMMIFFKCLSSIFCVKFSIRKLIIRIYELLLLSVLQSLGNLRKTFYRWDI